MGQDDEQERRSRQLTRQLTPQEVGGWPYAVDALERLNDWAVFALRLGLLALLQECVQAMAQPHARPALVVKARELVEALARIPWDPDPSLPPARPTPVPTIAQASRAATLPPRRAPDR